MILNFLPPEIEAEVTKLLCDEQFHKSLTNDKTINYLQSQKHDKNIEFQQLLLFLTRKNIIGGIAFKPITLALFSYLYCLRSNIIFDMSKITKEDLDIFFYLLQTKNFTHDISSLMKLSYDYGKKEYNLTYNEMVYIFNKLYKIEFRVFSLFPKTTIDGDFACNVDWMLNIISKVKPLVSYTTQELYTQISVSQIYYYYAQYKKMNGEDSIFIRNEQEILDEEDSRLIDLVIQRLIQKGSIKREERKKYFELMKRNKENE